MLQHFQKGGGVEELRGKQCAGGGPRGNGGQGLGELRTVAAQNDVPRHMAHAYMLQVQPSQKGQAAGPRTLASPAHLSLDGGGHGEGGRQVAGSHVASLHARAAHRQGHGSQ